MSKKTKVLILAGGGIWGANQIFLLNSLYIDDIKNYVDVISGCSIGGINALALAEGRSSSEMMNFYFDYSEKIFSSKNKDIFGCYSGKNMDKILKKLITGSYEDLKIPCFVPAIDFGKDKFFTFENVTRENNPYFSWMNWQIARATSAAPTYFPPFGRNNSEVIIDGGLGEVVPIVDTACNVRKLMGVEFKDMDVFVLGTGKEQSKSHTLKEVSRYNPIDWLTNMLIPYTTMSNEMTSVKWGESMGFNSFVYYNPANVYGSMDEWQQVIDGTLYNECAKYFDDFKEKFLNFVRR